MSSKFNETHEPQPPKVLTAPVEVGAALRQLLNYHDRLILRFDGREQRYQSYIVDIDRDSGVMALDEVMPEDGSRLISQGLPFNVEGYREGVRMSWRCAGNAQAGEFDGHPCFRVALPTELTHHQRRNAYRAPLKHVDTVKVDITPAPNKPMLSGQLLDISATGCKLRFAGDVSETLNAGQVYEQLSFHMPFGKLSLAGELRHVHYEDKVNMSFVGVRFHQMSGLDQRHVERFVYQLQREARRFESESVF